METSKKPESFIRKKNFIIIKSTRVWWMFLADVPRPISHFYLWFSGVWPGMGHFILSKCCHHLETKQVISIAMIRSLVVIELGTAVSLVISQTLISYFSLKKKTVYNETRQKGIKQCF